MTNSKSKSSSTQAKKTKTSKAKTTKNVAKESIVPVVAVESVNEVSTTSNATDNNSTVSDDFTSVIQELMTLRSSLTSLTAKVRSLKTRSERELKQAEKKNKRKKNANRSPSGFVKPTKISNELADFVGVAHGSEMARTEVTRVLTSYIREHKLQDPKNGRRILADKKLSALLKLSNNDELTYFNLQKHMSPHFAKKSDYVNNAV